MENKKTTEEIKDITGISTASNRADAEMDITTALLKAAAFKEDDDTVREVDIKRNGEVLFSVHVHPITDGDARAARKKATTFMKNPNGKGLPPIEKEFNSAEFHSWLIYFATTGEDRKRIWGNKAVMEQTGAGVPADTIDKLLLIGEKTKLVELVMDISGMSDDDEDENENVSMEEFAKN